MRKTMLTRKPIRQTIANWIEWTPVALGQTMANWIEWTPVAPQNDGSLFCKCCPYQLSILTSFFLNRQWRWGNCNVKPLHWDCRHKKGTFHIDWVHIFFHRHCSKTYDMGLGLTKSNIVWFLIHVESQSLNAFYS